MDNPSIELDRLTKTWDVTLHIFPTWRTTRPSPKLEAGSTDEDDDTTSLGTKIALLLHVGPAYSVRPLSYSFHPCIYSSSLNQCVVWNRVIC